MGLHHSDRRDAQANLARALQEKGWKTYGYDKGESDGYADYYRASCWHGVAIHPDLAGFAIVVGMHDTSQSETPIYRKYQEPGGNCRACNGSGVEPNALSYEDALKTPELAHNNKDDYEGGVIVLLGGWRVNRENYHEDGRPKCRKCRGSGLFMENKQEQVDTYPLYTDVPSKGVFWILQKDGQTIRSGKGMSQCAEYGADKGAAIDIAIDITEYCKNYATATGDRPTAIASDGNIRIETHISKGTSPSGKSGIEIKFSSPSLAGRDFVAHLKNNGYTDRCSKLGFRWSRRGFWYATYSESLWDRVHLEFGVQQKTADRESAAT